MGSNRNSKKGGAANDHGKSKINKGISGSNNNNNNTYSNNKQHQKTASSGNVVTFALSATTGTSEVGMLYHGNDTTSHLVSSSDNISSNIRKVTGGDRSIQSHHSTSASSSNSDSSNSTNTATAAPEFNSVTSNNAKNSSSNNNNNPKKLKQMGSESFELAMAIEEVQSSNNNKRFSSLFSAPSMYQIVSWNEIITLSFIIFAFACLSIMIGVAAGITITIQQYEYTGQLPVTAVPLVYTTGSTTQQLTSALSMPSTSSARRATVVDPMIAYDSYKNNNIPVYRQSQQVPSSASQVPKQSSLLLVEESPPLKQTSPRALTSTQQASTLNTMSSTAKSADGSLSDSTSYSENKEARRNSTGNCHDSNLSCNVFPDDRRYNSHELESRSNKQWESDDNGQQFPPYNRFSQWTSIPPILCSDGVTIGYNSFYTLRAAIDEANYFSAEQFVRWHRYYESRYDPSNKEKQRRNMWEHNPLFHYDEEIVFTVCPGTAIKSTAKNNKKYNDEHKYNNQRRMIQQETVSASTVPQLYINAENVVIVCADENCVYDISSTGGSHISFGPNAQQVLIKGLTFVGATSSSLQFYSDGADVTIEDCTFYQSMATRNRIAQLYQLDSQSISSIADHPNNHRSNKQYSSAKRSKNKRAKAVNTKKRSTGVADVRSYSAVNFYRCFLSNKDTPNYMKSSIIWKGLSSLKLGWDRN